MSETASMDIHARLVECGMEAKHAQIVMDLATHPPSKASEVGKRIGISRMDAYNSLRKMQDMGLIKATLDKPMRFLGIKIEGKTPKEFTTEVNEGKWDSKFT